MRVQLLTDAGYAFLSGMTFPVEVTAEPHRDIKGAISVTYEELIKVGAPEPYDLSPSHRWCFKPGQFQYVPMVQSPSPCYDLQAQIDEMSDQLLHIQDKHTDLLSEKDNFRFGYEFREAFDEYLDEEFNVEVASTDIPASEVLKDLRPREYELAFERWTDNEDLEGIDDEYDELCDLLSDVEDQAVNLERALDLAANHLAAFKTEFERAQKILADYKERVSDK
ncbi:hypothetical protein PU634_10450 [Oceanimonas pelagia]|uniref:Uncharacterized protein n=1 Tax=Oceanimonas pelagia TaxID=3028314 RepID=A0AA50QAY5_9GAMM|nr:hypothetical protein [Oceanimonas pelagia]WMC09536.1 hypothetical protein PU634_10450 [Oceanimonas pelagia]